MTLYRAAKEIGLNPRTVERWALHEATPMPCITVISVNDRKSRFVNKYNLAGWILKHFSGKPNFQFRRLNTEKLATIRAWAEREGAMQPEKKGE